MILSLDKLIIIKKYLLNLRLDFKPRVKRSTDSCHACSLKNHWKLEAKETDSVFWWNLQIKAVFVLAVALLFLLSPLLDERGTNLKYDNMFVL